MTAGAGTAPASGRALAPDLARGLMLMLIAVANIPWYLWGGDTSNSISHPKDGTMLDRAAQFVTMAFVDQRVYPMFAFLFGYGMVQFAISRRARGAGDPIIRRMLRRRHWALIGFGALHAALLFQGDILGTYGLAGLILVWLFFTRQNRTLMVWVSIMGGILAVFLVFSIVGAMFYASYGEGGVKFEIGSTAAAASYPASILDRLAEWALATASILLVPVIPLCILLAWLAARRRILEEPGRHLGLLRGTAIAGVSVGLVGGLTNALNHVGALGAPPEIWWAFYVLSMVTGVFGGVGYVALFGLIAHRIGQRRSLFVDLTTAVGRRSLSCYLAQSVVFAPILAAWGLGVGGWLGSAGAFAMACATWLAIAVGALALQRSGRQGPAEVVLRRITYVRLPDPAPAEPQRG